MVKTAQKERAYREIRASSLVAFVVTLAIGLLTASNAWADVYEIYTYGSGDFVAAIFEGVVRITGYENISHLIRAALVVGLLIAVVQPITGWLRSGHLPMNTGGEGWIVLFRQVILAAVVAQLMIIPKADVNIIDRLDPVQSQTVAGAPFVQVIIAHAASLTGDSIGKWFETNFSTPGALRFRTGGVGLGIKYVDTIIGIRPPSASTPSGASPTPGIMISESLRQFYRMCVFPNFANLGPTTSARANALYSLGNNGNILGSMQSYISLYGDPNIVIASPNTTTGTATCQTALGEIQSAWDGIQTQWYQEIEMRLAQTSSVDPTYLGTGALTSTVLNHYFPSGPSGWVMLKNLAAGNLFRDVAAEYMAAYGHAGDAAASLAVKSTAAGWVTTARIFGVIVHTMRNVFEGLIYGLSVLLPVAIALGGLSALGAYFKILIWLQLWVPFYAILNLYGDYEMAKSMEAIVGSLSGDGAPTMAQWITVGEKAQLNMAYIGSLSFAVPTFAWGLLKGGEYAMSAAVNAMSSGSGAASTAANVGGQAGMGNITAGQKSIGSDNFWTQSSNSSRLTQATVQGQFSAAGMVQELTRHGPLDVSRMGGMQTAHGTISNWNAAGGNQFGVQYLSGVKANIEAGGLDAKHKVAERVGLNDTQFGYVTTAAGPDATSVKAAKNISADTGISMVKAAERISGSAGKRIAEETAKSKNFFDQLAAGGISPTVSGEIKSRPELAKTMATKEHSLADWGAYESWSLKAMMKRALTERDVVGGDLDQVGQIQALKTRDDIGNVDATNAILTANPGWTPQSYFQARHSNRIGLNNSETSFGNDGKPLSTESTEGTKKTKNYGVEDINIGISVTSGNLANTATMNDPKTAATMFKGSLGVNAWQNDPISIGARQDLIERMVNASYYSVKSGNQVNLQAQAGGGVDTPVASAGVKWAATATDEAHMKNLNKRMQGEASRLAAIPSDKMPDDQKTIALMNYGNNMFKKIGDYTDASRGSRVLQGTLPGTK